MSGQNPPKNISDSIRNALNKAAFSGRLRDNLSIFTDCSYAELISLFPDKSQLCTQLEEIAFQEKADTFEKIVTLFKHDEDALASIIAGFGRDDAFTNNRQNYGDWGVDPNPEDFKKKRIILQNLAIELSRQNNAELPVTHNTSPIKIRKMRPPNP